MEINNTRRGNTQTKTNSHAEVSLLSISSALTTQGGDPEQKLFRMTLFDKGAFTLIELLVVVLIIGILAAVALPQYNKAVTKTRGTEALEAADVLDKALSAYYLEHGSYAGVNANSFNMQIPELKHFRYAVSSTNFESGASDFSSLIRKDGDYQYTGINIVAPDNTRIQMDWEHGKLESKTCVPGNKKCEDYFVCSKIINGTCYL